MVSLHSRSLRRHTALLMVTLLLLASMFTNVAGVAAAPIPSVPILGDQDIFLGDPATFTFNFANSGPDTGYGPFIELAVDTTGPDGAGAGVDDGMGIPTVTVAGLPLSPVGTITVAGANFTNPLTGDVRPVPAGFGNGDTIYIYALPFGSFTPGQTTATITNIPTSNLADIGTPLPIALTPGFRDDDPSLAGPAFYGTTATGSVTPKLYTLNKIYLGPESETATGPNYVRRYRLEVEVAPGQTVTNLRVTDILAASMQLVGRDTEVIAGGPNIAAFINGTDVTNIANLTATAGANTASPGFPTRPSIPGGTLTYTFASVTGNANGVDAALEFNFYVPRDDSGGVQVVPQTPLASPTAGTDSTTATNTTNSLLNWVPIDTPRDPNLFNVPPAAAGSILSHTLEQHSLAIQKTAALFNKTTGAPITQAVPGNTIVRYTLDFQVSDYYAVQNVVVNDVLDDGLRLYTGTVAAIGGLPTLTVNNAYLRGGPPGSRTNTSGVFGGGNIDYQRSYTLQSALPSGTLSDPTSFPGTGPIDPAFSAPTVGTIDGSTWLNFDISAELVRRLGANAGRLVGGEINDDGTGPDNDLFAGPRLGATTGTIVFYAEISQDFSDNFPSSDRSIDQGDVLANTLANPTVAGRDGIIAQQIRPSEINAVTPTVIGTATDDSGADVEIGYGVQTKTIYAINGTQVPSQTFSNPPFTVQAGDTVTYQLTYTLPINSYEQLRISDFPPLPVMAVGNVTNYSFDGITPTFAPYSVAIEAAQDTFFSTSSFIGTPVQAATVAALGGGTTYNETGGTAGNGAFTGAPGTIDDVALLANNLVLVKNQADQRQNGVYRVVSAGNWERAASMDIEGEVESSRLIRANGGTVNSNDDFVQTNNQFSIFNLAGARGDIIFTPFITTDTTNNEITLNFGNFDDPNHPSTTIAVLITLPVSNDPFAADLFLTNQLRVNEASTNNGTTTVEDLRRFELVRPDVTVDKGVVGANVTGFTLGGIIFTNPSVAANFSGGPVDTIAEADAIGARNITVSDAVDAGDEIRYAIVAQNVGKGDAYDLILQDQIPLQYNRATFNPVTDLVLRRGDAATTLLATQAAVTGFVRLATTADVGGAFNAGVGNGQITGATQLIDGYFVNLNDRVLVKNQATAAQNGIYEVTAVNAAASTITLTRATEADSAAELSGYQVAVAGGDTNADNHFQFGAVATLNTSAANAGAALGIRDYYTIYDPATGDLRVLISDNYDEPTVGAAYEDIGTGSLSRAIRVDQTSGDLAITNGSNTIIALYDVTLQPAVTPNLSIVNTVIIPSYSNNNGGPDLTNPAIVANAVDPTDTATVVIKLPIMAKTLVSTEVDAVGNNNTGGLGAQATIGELITYQVTLTVPEGSTPGASIADTLNSGLAFVDITNVQLSSTSLSTSNGLTFANNGATNVTTLGTNTVVAAVGGENGRGATFTLGNITNTNTDNAVVETITITYRAVVLNTNGTGGTANNQSAATRNNSARLAWTNNTTTVAIVSSGRTTGLTGSASGTTTPVTIVEPTLTNLKDVRNVTQGETFPVAAGTPQTTRGDAGDTIEYRITIANPAAGSTTANDVTMSDQLPVGFFSGGAAAFSVSSVTTTGAGQIRRNAALHTLTIADFTISGAGLLELNPAFNYDIDPNVTITILVQGAGFTGATGQLITNTADVRWTSLDGTPGTRSTHNTTSTERTGADGEIGGGTLNDYRDTDTAVIESPPIVRKTVVSTSEAHTTGSNAAIAEIVRFRLVASVAEGTSRNFVLQDFLPAGMSFFNDGTARWALVSTSGNVISSSTVANAPGFGAVTTVNGGIDGNQATLGGIASAAIIGTFADANISTDANGVGTGEGALYADGADVFFRFGTLQNIDSDTDVEYAIVEFNALVGNQVSNQAGTALNNTMTILADTDNNGTAGYIDVVNDTNGDGVGTGEATIVATDADNDGGTGPNTPAQSAPATVTVVEPTITVDKQAIATDGTIVTYRVTLTASAAANTATAFSVRALDVMNVANFTLNLGSIAPPTFTGGASGSTNASAGNTVDITITTMPTGSTATFTYQATVLTTPTGAASLDNTVNVTYTDLPGTNGTGGSWTGVAATSSAVPGAAGTATGERTGQDGVGLLNDYVATDTERLGSLGNRVYFDADGDGVQDVGEPGIVGVPVTVLWAGPDGNFTTAGDNSTIIVTTGTDGAWTVNALPLGATSNYRVSAPTDFTDMALTDVRDNGGAANNDPDGLGVGISAITLTGGSAATTNSIIQDFGYRGTASLGNRIYVDANGDGVQDAVGLEPSLPGVVTTLLWAGPDNDFTTAGDNLTFTQNSTNAATNYLYSNLPSGDFRVTVSATGGTGGVPLNMVLTDAIDNGGAANTDPNGLGAGVVQTNLTIGENELTIDFGYQGNASLGDRVYYDVDGDGVQDANESGIAGVTVTAVWFGADNAFAGGDDVLFTTTTNASGNYTFQGIPANALVGGNPNYRVTSATPAAYPTLTDSLDNAALSATNPIDVQVSPINGNALNDRGDVDFGWRGTAQLGNLVWLDQNGNGRQDGGTETGIDGVTVQLFFDNNNDGDFLDAGEATAIATTTTAGGGLYSFANLAAGNYQVAFGNSDGVTTYTRTVRDSVVATDATDSDADTTTGRTDTYNLVVGEIELTVDQGLYVPVSIGDRVYYDNDGDGVQDAVELGIPNATVTVTCLGPDATLGTVDDITYAGVTTGSSGDWVVSGLPPGSFSVEVTNLPGGVTLTDSIDNGGAVSPVNPVTVSTNSNVNRIDIDFGYRGNGSIGDRVFLDVNNNGLWDAGEGIAGVTVTLLGDLNGDGSNDTLTATTDADGFYQFNNLRVTAGGVPYTVTIDTTDIPQDGAGSPLPNTVDPDTAGTGNSTSAVTLTTAVSSNQDQDFGYRGLGQIGDTIFLDANSNDTPDTGEGITGVGVTLSGDLDGDAIAETFTTTTNASGVYGFANLPVRTPAGTVIDYTVTVDTATLSTGLINTVDPDTANPGNSTSVVALPTAGAPVNLLQDFGYRGVGSIGDRIFLDLNNNNSWDAGEGITGVTVNLVADLNGDGVNETLIATTDADGFYQFNNLPIFQRDGATTVAYTVNVVTATLPTGVTNTVDPDGGLNNTSALTLSLATPSNQDQDFGYRGTASLGDRVWIDADGDAVQDSIALEPGIPGVTMQLTWAGQNGTFGDADDTTSAIATDSTGAYVFNGLPPGTFRVNVAPANLPANVAQTYDLDGLVTANQADRTLTLAEAATNVDFGYRGNASLGNRVWLDQDADGIQDAIEVGVPGATIRVTWYGTDAALGGGDDIVFTVVTVANGLYLLDGIPANPLVAANPNYQVEVTGLPIAGLIFIDSIDDGAVNAINPVNIQVSPVDGNLLNDRRDVDFGYDGASSLAGTVYRDDNNNGVQEGTELGIQGVRIVLTGLDLLGNPVLDPATGLPYETLTDTLGNYLFPTVPPGTFTITEFQPANYNDGIDTAGSLGGNAGNDVISGIAVGANQDGVEYNFGELGTFLSGVVFRDDNRDGALDAAETTRLPGVTIELYDSTGATLLATTNTLADGSYRFDNLAIGTYQVRETQPVGYADSPAGPFAPNTRNVSVPAAGLPNQNFGEILGSIAGMVYIDANTSSTRQPSETGISNIPITLTGTDINGNVVNVTVSTDTTGRYIFTNLLPPQTATSYTITEGAAAPYTDQASNVGTGLATPGTSTNPNTIGGIGINPGQQGIDYDFGEILPAQAFISGSVYRDDDRDGLRDGGEPAIPTVTLTLYDSGPDGVFGNLDDGPTRTTTTDGVGNYLFASLPTGHNYQVVESQPSAYGNSPAGPTVLIAVNNLPATGSINNNYGEILGSLAGAVYFDANNNGTRDAGEPGIAGATVTLTGTDVNGAAVSLTATTAADGSYLFSNLATGNYVVTETQPAVYADGAETIGSVGGISSANDVISAIPLGAGVDAVSYNFGETGVPVSGVVFYDEGRDGTLDVGEVVRLPGVTIQLVNGSGVIVATTTTQPDGSYLFTNVPPGNYTIIEIQPTGYGDPLVGPFAPNSRPITVTNTAITNQNFGDTLSTLAGSVYVDTSNDGIRQGGEAGISGVPVRLDWAGLDGTFGTADDLTGFASTTTGADGSYLFTDLRTGVYRVVEPNQPAPYTDGIDTAGSAGGDISTNEQITDIPIAAGVDLTDYNFGELPPANPFISGSVYIDTNNNGTRDPGEPGIPGTTVTLTGPGGPFTTTTDANGNYLFANLTAAGNYIVTETQPAAYGNGIENPGNVINVNNLPAAGSTNNNFGELPGTISGVVYFDSDSSSTLTGGDLPIVNVTVTLQDGTGAAVNNPLTGQPYVLTTLADGSYLFENLPAGNYRVVETQPTGYNDGAETPGIGNTSTVNDRIDVTLAAGGDSPDNNFGELGTTLSGTVWIDTDRDGTIDGTETGRLGNVLITLVDSNGAVVATTTTSALDGSYSFGNLLPGNYTIIQTQPSAYGSSTPNSIPVNLPLTGLTNQNFGETLGSLAGVVFADLNRNGIRDAGEPGIPGVAVDLTGTDVNGGLASYSTFTGADGSYSFGDLPAGTYEVVETQPTAYDDGQEQAGTAGGNTATNDLISSIPLGAGVNATGYNFGEISSSISGTVWLDRDRNGGFDSGEPGVPGVTIELRDTLGNLIATTTTGADGSYSFVGLAGGDYVIVELQPNGYGSSTANSIPVTVPNGGSVPDQNFGETLGSISGSVYIDTDDNGVRDVGETGIPNTTITLTGTDVNGNPVNLTTTTDSNGNYSFGDLVAGNYTVTETQPLNHGDGRDAIGSAGGTISNDQVSGISVTAGSDEAGYDFGENPLSPTAVVLVSFSATHAEGGVLVGWETSAELNTWGFQLYRSTTGERADAVLVTPEQIAASGRGQGASYEWMDTSAEAGVTYTYWLVETELGGATHTYGPVRTAVGTPTAGMYTVALPMIVR